MKKWFKLPRSGPTKRLQNESGSKMKQEQQMSTLNTGDSSEKGSDMPFGKRKSEKYELNVPSDKNRESYGSCKQEDGTCIIDADQLDEETETTSNEDGLTMTAQLAYDSTTDFRDGKKKIDYILVFEESHEEKTQQMTEKAHNYENRRNKFMANLVKAGIVMEEEVVESEKNTMHFIKLSCPWPVLVNYAETLRLRAPLQAHQNQRTNWSKKILKAMHIPNLMDEYVPNEPMDFFTCAFRKSKLDKFIGHDNQDTYFSRTQRIQIVSNILQSAVFGKRKKAEIGIARLVDEGAYTTAYPLHDGPYQMPEKPVPPESLNKRQVLYHYWARWGKWYKYQPIDHVREYLGEKIAIYFAWLGFYTAWLLPAAAVGLLVFMYGVATVQNDNPSTQICESGDEYLMCPSCEETNGCKYVYLSESCLYSKLAYLFDHPGTVFYAIFVSFWAVTFLENWKRKSASLAHHWDCMDFEEEEEKPRPEFAAKAPLVERNPITNIKEPAFPPEIRLKRMVAGAGVILVMMTLVIIFIVAVIIYRVLVSSTLFRNPSLRDIASIISSSTGAVVNLIFIMALGRVYEKLALILTQWEMHRTQTEFESNLTFKVFIFQFINFYSSIFYIAFFKGKFAGYPGHYRYMFGLRNEECSSGGCLMELAQQLAIIMIGKQIINNVQEICIPKVKAWIHRIKTRFDNRVQLTRWEEDYQLIDNEGLFQEYLEMVLQFGFITIFVAAFPLAPLFALLNNWVEIRLDAQKFICETRRVVAERAQNIGIWFTILEVLAHLAVISNAFLIAFTSEFLPKMLYMYEYSWNLSGYVNFTLAWSPNGTLSQDCRYNGFRDSEGHFTKFYWRLLALRFGFVIIFEHVVFFICRLIDMLVPDIPEELEYKIKRERWLAKQALADSETILKVAQREDTDNEDDDEEGMRHRSHRLL